MPKYGNKANVRRPTYSNFLDEQFCYRLWHDIQVRLRVILWSTTWFVLLCSGWAKDSLGDLVDACWRPFSSVNSIKKSWEFAFLTRIFIQKRSKATMPLEKCNVGNLAKMQVTSILWSKLKIVDQLEWRIQAHTDQRAYLQQKPT